MSGSIMITGRRASLPRGVPTLEYQLDNKEWVPLSTLASQYPGQAFVTAVRLYDASIKHVAKVHRIIKQGWSFSLFLFLSFSFSYCSFLPS